MEEKTKVLFICLGNICRSPMAEFIFKKMLSEQGLSEKFIVASAATSREEIGNPVYPPAQKILAEHNISCKNKYAVQVKAEDYYFYDYLIVMEDKNAIHLENIVGNDKEAKIWKLLDFSDKCQALKGRNISDPWYTGNFQKTYNDIEKGCRDFLIFLKKTEKIKLF